MSLVSNGGGHGESPEIQVQSLGPAILTPAQEIGNIVAKGNEIVADHREWLAKFPQLEGQVDLQPIAILPSTSRTSSGITTPPPSLELRAAFPAPMPQQLVPSALCDCNPQISAVSASFLASLSRIFITAGQSAQLVAQSVAVALSIEQSASSAALMSEGLARSSASAASVSAALSASSAIQSAINSANSAIAAAQASAAAVVNSANSLAADAKATATFAVAQAQATISQVNVQASASVQASHIASMTEARFTLALTFSIIGSSLASILAYFLLLHYQKRRRLAKQDDMARGSMSSSKGPSLSEFPYPRKSEWSFVRAADPQRAREPQLETELILPDEPSRALFLSLNPAPRLEREERIDEWEGPRPPLERKNTPIYDAERPDQPPRFKELLVESLRSVSPFGNRRSKDMKATRDGEKRESKRRMSKVMFDDDVSEIGTAL